MIRVMSSYYNPQGYVRGGASPAVARAIMQRARKRPVIKRPPTITTGFGLGGPGRSPHPISNAKPPVATPSPTPPANPLWGRANSVVGGMFAPLIKQLAEERMRAEAGMKAAYDAHGGAVESALKATAAPVAGAYDQSIGMAAKANEALANRLGAQGQSASGDLATQLAQIGANPQGAAELAQTYTGAGNAGFAADTADLQHLIGQRGEALAYTGKLPQIARLETGRDYQNALAQARGSFNERERGLQEQAVSTAWEHYNQLRNEGLDAKKAREEAKQAELDRRAQERMSMAALRATAQSKQQELYYDQQIKAQERQWEIEDRNLERQWEIDDMEFEANTDPGDKRTGPASQQWITVNGKVVKNPNYKPPKAAASGRGSTTDSWQTPGSAKRNRVEQKATQAVLRFNENGMPVFTPEILRRLKKFPLSGDAIINTAINTAIRGEGIKNVNSPAAKAIRAKIRQQLSGTTWQAIDPRDKVMDTFTFEA